MGREQTARCELPWVPAMLAVSLIQLEFCLGGAESSLKGFLFLLTVLPPPLCLRFCLPPPPRGLAYLTWTWKDCLYEQPHNPRLVFTSQFSPGGGRCHYSQSIAVGGRCRGTSDPKCSLGSASKERTSGGQAASSPLASFWRYLFGPSDRRRSLENHLETQHLAAGDGGCPSR